MVRGRSTPVIFGGHFHVTRFGMFRSRAGLALNPCQRQPVHGLPTGTGPFSTLKRRHPDSASFTEQGEECLLSTRNVVKWEVSFSRHSSESWNPASCFRLKAGPKTFVRVTMIDVIE